MTSYRFRVKFEYDPTALWRDIIVGANRTLEEFQSVINGSVGLNQAHLWFFGTDRDYWQSPVQYKRSEELDLAGPTMSDETEYDASETTIGQMVRHLDLDEGDRICYLFDYGDEWRFYAILNEVDAEESGDREPIVVKEKGEPVEQYALPDDW